MVKKCFPFNSFFVAGWGKKSLGVRSRLQAGYGTTLTFFFNREYGYTIYGMRLCIVFIRFTFSKEVWMLFGCMIFHELLQDCDLVLCIDSAFCWTRMNESHATEIEENNDRSLIRGLHCSSLFWLSLEFSHPLGALLLRRWIVSVNPNFICHKNDLPPFIAFRMIVFGSVFTHFNMLLFLFGC